MLKVPTPQIDVKRDTTLEMPNPDLSERAQRPRSSVSSRLSFRTPDLNLEQFQPVALCCLKRENKPRIWFIKLMSWPWFERVSILVILVNCVTLGMYDPFDTSCVTEQCQVLERLETAIYAFFLVEMLIKWVAMGLFGKQGYFKDSWNKLDCFIVAAGSFELAYGEGEYLSAVRSIRVLRPLRAINRVPSIRILVTLLLDTLPMLGNVLAICFFIFAIFGIIGVQLWQGLLRNRCFADQLNDTIKTEYNLSSFYRPSFDKPDYVCSLPSNNGLSKCDKSHFNQQDFNDNESNQTSLTMNSSYWNQFYTTCRDSGQNIYWGSISFDNIGIATVAIFQIITLEGWTDIMYTIQDAHSFWNWVYFVVLILIGSYFMTNLCLVVITSQFQETKQRETELLKLSRLRSRASVSTVSSSFMQQGCYTQILNYIEHLCRRLKRRVKSRLKIESSSKRRRVTPCLQLKTRKGNIKCVHHHHHHYHYYHHYVHHHPCQCSSEFSDSPPTSGEHRGVSPPSADHPLGISQDMQDSKNPKEGKRNLVVPQIQVFAQAATAIYKDAGTTSSGEMVSTATANMNVQGHDSSASVVTYSKSTDAVAVATQATTQTIEAACSCAARQSGEENIHVITKAYEDSVDSSDDDEGSCRTKKDRSCFEKFRDNMKVLVEGTWFTRVIMASIFLNTICMAVEHHGQPETMTGVLEIFNIIFTSIFALEMLGKILAFGPYGYIKDAYNLFDGVIVVVSLMDILADSDTSGISVLRSFRLLRIFKLVRFMPALQRQLSVMIKTLDNVMTFLALLLLFIFTSSILGMHLFGGKYQFPDEDGQLVTSRANFDTLFWALVTVFQVLTQEDWNVVLYDGMRSLSSWAALYFVFLMIIGNYILFNLLVAILVEGFADHSENERLSLKGEKDAVETLCVPAKPDQKRTMQADLEIAHSWPNINSMLEDETLNAQQLSRCESAPGRHEVSQKPKRSSSYLHVLTVDALQSEHSAEETGYKHEKTRCISPEDEDSSLVPLHSKKTSRDNSIERSKPPSCFKRRANWSLYLFSPENRFRQLMVKMHSHVWFDRVVLFFIIFNCAVMALEEPGLDQNSKKGQFIHIMQYIFTAIFTIEMSIKVISLGLVIGPHTYLKSGWNVIDGVLVLFSLIDLVISLATNSHSGILGVLRVFRAFRTLRPLRVINRAPELKLVVETLMSSLKPIGNVVLIAATFFTIFGILGVQLFKGKFYSCHNVKSTIEIKNKSQCLLNHGEWLNNEYNFDNLARALLTLFVFATRDGWVSIMYSGVDAVDVDEQPIRDNSKWNVLYFVAFLLLAGFVVLNMLVGIVVENFHKCRNELLKEQNMEKSEKNEVEERSRSNSISDIDYEQFAPWRRKLFLLVTHDYFDLVIAVVIGINVLCMTMEHYDQPKNLTLFLKYANYVFTIMFIIEAVLKILALGLKNYFRNRWNCLDMMIVLLSIGGIVLDELATSNFSLNPTIIRVMRVLRITRVLKLLKAADGIRSLLDTVGKALPQVANLGMLFLLLFFIFGALGMELFGKITCDKVECDGLDTHAHFRNFGYSVLTLFRVSTGDNWNGILKDTIDSKRCETGEIEGCEIIQNIAPIYFASFVLITQFVLLNVVVAVMMKHLEESKFDETKSIKNHSPRTPRLFLGKRSPGTRRRSKNSPRLAKRSQQSLRSPKSESGILKKKKSLNVNRPQRRARSLGEIRNNNLRLSYNSGSDSDCVFDDTIVRKVSGSLRQRKPSFDDDNFYEMLSTIKKQETSEKSKNPVPVLEIVDVGDSDSSEPLAKTSTLLLKPPTSFVCPSEPVVNTSEPFEKTSNAPVKSSEPFVPGSQPSVNNEESAKNVSKNAETKSKNEIGQSSKDVTKTNILQEKSEKTEKVLKEDGCKTDNAKSRNEIEQSSENMTKINILQEKNEKTEKVLKENGCKTDNAVYTLPMENKEGNEHTEIKSMENERLDTKQTEQNKKEGLEHKEKEFDRKMKEMDELNERTESKENAENENMNEDLQKRKKGNDRRKSKDELSEKVGKNPEGKETLNVEDNLNNATNKEGNSRQTRDQTKAVLVQPKRNDEPTEQDSNIVSKFHKDTLPREHQETLGFNEGSQVNLVNNNNQTKNSHKEHLGVDEAPGTNLMDDTCEKKTSHEDHIGTIDGAQVNVINNSSEKKSTGDQNLLLSQGSQVNFVDNSGQNQDSHDEGIHDDTKQECDKRTQIHGNRLEPVPDNLTKLPPPESNA